MVWDYLSHVSTTRTDPWTYGRVIPVKPWCTGKQLPLGFNPCVLGSESPDCKNVAMVLTHQSIGPASLVGLLIIGSAALQYGGLPVVRYDLAKLIKKGIYVKKN